MKMSNKIFDNIAESDFIFLLNSLDENLLRENLIKFSRNLPKDSDYYNGKTSGRFWNGYRKEKIPKDRIFKFYIEEVYHNKNNFDNVLDKFITCLKEYLDCNELNVEDKILSFASGKCTKILCSLFELQIDDEIIKTSIERNKLTEGYKEIISQYDSEIKQKENKNSFLEKEIDSLKKTISKLESELKLQREQTQLEETSLSEITTLENQVIQIENNYIGKIKRICENKIDSSRIKSSIDSLNIKDYNQLSAANIELSEYLKSNIIQGVTKDLHNILFIQYILICLMEEKNEYK